MYNLFYNLNDRPFGLKPDLKYFHTTRPHKRAMLHLLVGFQQPDGALILTGDKGMGKTTLITYMLNQLDKSDNLVAFIQKPPQKDHDFLPAILAALQIPITESQPRVLFNTLHKFILEQAKLNKKVLLVVDDAESLSHSCFEFISLLSTLHHNENGLMQIVLVGSNKLDVTLASTENQAFRQQIAMSYCMHPLQISDTREYIEHRLKIAGWNGDPIIDDKAFDAIHQLTGGIPYDINRYCDRLLMLGMLSENHHLNTEDVASLTSTTMAKLEKFETVQLKQDKHIEPPETIEKPLLASQTEHKQEALLQNTIKELELETTGSGNTPKKNSNKFFDMRTLFTIVATAAISYASVTLYNDMLLNNSTHAPAVSHTSSSETHAASTNHADTANSHDSHQQTAHAPSEHNTHQQADNSHSPMEFLSIGQLSKKLSKPGAESHNNHSTKNAASESGHNLSAPHAAESTSTPGIASFIQSLSTHSEPPTSHGTHAGNIHKVGFDSHDSGGAACEGFGPQTPRDIDNVFGTNKRKFNMAPAAEKLNLCNIHFHNNAEHKASDFSIYAGEGEHGHGGGYQCGMSKSLSAAELRAPAGEICNGLKPGDTIEVHWVHTSCNIKPGKGLGSCVSEACANPDLRVETQVFTVVNDPTALNFNDLSYEGNMRNGKHQAKMLPTGTGRPVQFTGSTTGPKYTEQSCSPYQVTWSVRPKCAKVDINSLGQWCKGNAFEEDHAHGVRKLVTNPKLLSQIN